MTKKAISTVLFLFLALGFASTSGAAETIALAEPTDNFPTGTDRVGDQFLVATTGGGANWSCVGAVFGFSLTALAFGAATGGAGLAIAGAYAPLLVVLCE